MPQLDFSTYASQIFWLFLGFTVLYFFMSKIALPRIGDILSNREDRITNDLLKAEQLKQEAMATGVDFASVLNAAKVAASQIMEKVHAETAEKLAKRNAELDRTLEKQQQQAEKALIALSKETKDKMHDVSVDLIYEITEKLIGKKLETNYIKQQLSKVISSS